MIQVDDTVTLLCQHICPMPSQFPRCYADLFEKILLKCNQLEAVQNNSVIAYYISPYFDEKWSLTDRAYAFISMLCSEVRMQGPITLAFGYMRRLKELSASEIVTSNSCCNVWVRRVSPYHYCIHSFWHVFYILFYISFLSSLK